MSKSEEIRPDRDRPDSADVWTEHKEERSRKTHGELSYLD